MTSALCGGLPETPDKPFLLSKMQIGGKPTSTAPELGQDTETTLLELGYTWDDLVILKEQGAII